MFQSGICGKGKAVRTLTGFFALGALILIATPPAASVYAGTSSNFILTKSVGTDPDVCSTSNTLTVAFGETVYYCYTLANIGSSTATVHSLTDDQLGDIFTDFPLDLPPGGTVSITAASVASASVVNTAIWSATDGTGASLGSVSAIANLIVVRPTFGIVLTKTVGTDPNDCSSLDLITVDQGETVYYCYTAENIGSSSLTHHTLVDDQLGTILDDFLLDLPTGGMVSITAASVASASVINTATWSARSMPGGPILDMSVDTAVVIVQITGPTATPTPIGPTPTFTPTDAPTATPTNTPPASCDAGYYVLDSFGGRHRVGNPPVIMGPVYFGNDIARDLEKAVCNISGGDDDDDDGPTADLVVLDGFGAVHFVANAACNIAQDFYFADQAGSFPQGRAVDLQMTADSAGFWVLTDFGEIYRAGSAGTTPLGVGDESVLGFDIPTMRDPGTATLPVNGTSLRAVSFVAIDEDQDSQADGYVVLDSMGGRFYYESDGSDVVGGSRAGEPVNDPELLLDPDAYVWPFFPGLDIARDIELHQSQQGVVILDGWDGIHPVPVNDPTNPVFFARNEDSMGGTAQTVGMPYIVLGFDDPTTGGFPPPDTLPIIDEGDGSVFGLDAESIFTDLEFAEGCEGLYTLDKFGGVFVLGDARPDALDPSPNFGNSPYFFPFLYAEDMEVFGPESPTAR